MVTRTTPPSRSSRGRRPPVGGQALNTPEDTAVLRRARRGGYASVGTAADGTVILAPKVDSKRFTLEEIQQTIARLRRQRIEATPPRMR